MSCMNLQNLVDKAMLETVSTGQVLREGTPRSCLVLKHRRLQSMLQGSPNLTLHTPAPCK